MKIEIASIVGYTAVLKIKSVTMLSDYPIVFNLCVSASSNNTGTTNRFLLSREQLAETGYELVASKRSVTFFGVD